MKHLIGGAEVVGVGGEQQQCAGDVLHVVPAAGVEEAARCPLYIGGVVVQV